MPSGRQQWVAVAKAIYGRFGEVQVTDRAAALTYYSILSLFPALLVVVSAARAAGDLPRHLPEHRQHASRRGARGGHRRDRQRAAGLTHQSRRRRRPAGRRAGARALLGLGGDGGGDALPGGDQPGEAGPELPPQSRGQVRADRAARAAGSDRLSRRGRGGTALRQHRRRGRVPGHRRRAWSATCAGRSGPLPCSPRSPSSTRWARGGPHAPATAHCARCFPEP